MIAAIRAWYRNDAGQPYVRPWGLAGPILVLIVCLPLLRPLRLPDPTEISQNELERLATIQAIVEHKTLAIDDASIVTLADRPLQPRGMAQTHHYSKQPPVLAAVLAGPYWLMYHIGLSFDSNPALTVYILTLLGATLPVAAAAGILYRLGRLFELSRPRRTLLAVAGVFGSGLVSYATVLNAHAPAAALVLAAFGCFYHALTSKSRGHSFAWLLWAGLNASFAAVIDLGAVAFLALLVLVILAARWPMASKVTGIGCYALAALAPLALHAVLTVPITGDLRPGFLHPDLCNAVVESPAECEDPGSEIDDERPGFFTTTTLHLVDGILGPHGLLSHFPILLIGLGGVGAVMHRHWPSATKMLAIISVAAAVLIVITYATLDADWDQPMFAARWFIIFIPAIILWGGAWLRQNHRPLMWSGAAALLVFSIVTTLLGAASPFTRTRPGEYTVLAAAKQLFRPASTPALVNSPPLRLLPPHAARNAAAS